MKIHFFTKAATSDDFTRGEAIMVERFGKDNVLALATAADNVPYVRSVNAYYENGAFYVITCALSGKMRQLAENPTCALAGEWFTAHGMGESMGWFRRPENAPIAAALRCAFAEWIDNGHNTSTTRTASS